MLLESHNSSQNPASCNSRADEGFQHEILSSLWVNDTDLAAFLEQTYGMRVWSTPIDFSLESLPAGEEVRVEWGPDETRSWFAIPHAGIQTPPVDMEFRYFWYNGTILGAMDFYWRHTRDQTADQPVTGEMYEPMLVAEFSEDYYGLGMWHEESSARGEIELFRDTRCEQPV